MEEVNVLYKRGRDLILFDFHYYENEDDLSGLIDFHFCERHDFNEMVDLCAKSVFKDFYDQPNNDEPELIDWESKTNNKF